MFVINDKENKKFNLNGDIKIAILKGEDIKVVKISELNIGDEILTSAGLEKVFSIVEKPDDINLKSIKYS